MEPLARVTALSLERWDDVWRRNQHLAAEMVGLGLVEHLTFVAPAVRLGHVATFSPVPGITVRTPHLLMPQHRGGLALVAREVRRRALKDADVVWINDARLGRRCLGPAPAVYDVTDDWRAATMPERDREELIAAEGELASRARQTVVCSRVLEQRWRDRYGVEATVVQNGFDANAFAEVPPLRLATPSPHVVYVGTLHDERLDVALLLALADSLGTGTLHLVGPDNLRASTRASLQGHPRVLLHGPVPHELVPAWLRAADVLICPHVVTDFTLSLDAIKAHEYLASQRPVVATPTSGFQDLDSGGTLKVVPARDFVDSVRRAIETPPTAERMHVAIGWPVRARAFFDVLAAAAASQH